MKYLYLFSIIFVLASCQSAKPILFFTERTIGGGNHQLEPGVCYYSVIDSMHGIFRKAQMLEIQDPVYKFVQKRLPDSLIAQYQLLEDVEKIVIPIKEYGTTYRFLRRPHGCLYEAPWSYYIICIVSAPGYNQVFSKKELDSLDYNFHYQKQISPAKILARAYKGIEKGVLDNQLYVPAGRYSKEYRRAMCGTSCFGSSPSSVFLKNRGYKPTTNRKVINKALVEFGLERMPSIIKTYFRL
jgi:hypothetical protein